MSHGSPMKRPAPSTSIVHRAVISLLRKGNCDCSERSIRCHMLYQPSHASYVVWVQRALRPLLSVALSALLRREFTLSSDFWILRRADVECLIAAGS